MFPIPWNKAFRKKDGTIVNMEDAMSGGGGGYTLPTASAETKGGVKIGDGLEMIGEVLSVIGGSGSSNMHLYVVTGSNRVELAPLLIITKYDGEITNGTTLRTALADNNGVAIGIGAKYNNYSLLDRVTISSESSTAFGLVSSQFTISDGAITIATGSSNLNVTNVTNLVTVKII